LIKVANSPPRTVDELFLRAQNIAGLTLGELAQISAIKVPKDFKREKGWTGQLLELYLGAAAGVSKQQDFPDLGIELKTIPISAQGVPLETTYVCYAPLTSIEGIYWLQSNVKNKLNCVLWIPIEGHRSIPPANRRIAAPCLWRPNVEQSQALRQDWEELMEMIAMGRIDQVTARHGEVLQIRPKAADGKALTEAIGENGQMVKTRPRGFYLRKQFTAEILKQYFVDE
jgi:DNA mismatch repair protein MutH